MFILSFQALRFLPSQKYLTAFWTYFLLSDILMSLIGQLSLTYRQFLNQSTLHIIFQSLAQDITDLSYCSKHFSNLSSLVSDLLSLSINLQLDNLHSCMVFGLKCVCLIYVMRLLGL